MKTIKYIFTKYAFFILVFLLTSCWSFHKITDNAWYKLNDISIRLVENLQKDTLIYTAYEHKYNLAGKSYPLLTTTNKINKLNPFGVQIKLWAKIVVAEDSIFYGYSPRNGLLGTIETISIQVANKKDTIDIKPYLHGNANLSEIKWRYLDYKKTSYTYGNSKYFETIEEWIYTMNNESVKLGRLTDHDYIFWIDNEVLRIIKPNSKIILTLKVKLSNNEIMFLKDSTEIN